jgi:hypothetical protein
VLPEIGLFEVNAVRKISSSYHDRGLSQATLLSASTTPEMTEIHALSTDCKLVKKQQQPQQQER